MGRRVIGAVLFLWMALCVVGLFREGGITEHSGTRLILDAVILVVLLALCGLGLTMLFGRRPAKQPQLKRDEPATPS